MTNNTVIAQGDMILTNRPWDRQPDESEILYEMFTKYRNMHMRTIMKVAALYASGEVDGKKRSEKTYHVYVHKMASRFKWVERARAYDMQVKKRLDDLEIDGLASARLAALNDSITGLDKIRKACLQFFDEGGKITSAKTAAAMYIQTTKLTLQLMRMNPDEIVIGEISDTELMELIRLKDEEKDFENGESLS